MPVEEIRGLGAGLIPFLVILFACEIGSAYELYNKNVMSERDMFRRTAYYIVKLPIGALLPAIFNFRGAIALAGLTVYSVLAIVKEQHLLSKLENDQKKGNSHDDR